MCARLLVLFNLCAVGWGRDYRNEGFGEQNGIKHQLVAVITAVQTLLRGECVLADVTGNVSYLEGSTKAKLVLTPSVNFKPEISH